MKINKIYGIKNKEGQVVYVGKTNQELSERMWQHKNDSNHEVKMKYLNDPENECKIELLYSSEFKHDIPEWEQYYINEFKNDSPIFFNRIRAKKMTPIEKHCTIKILKRQNNTIDGEFISQDDFDDFDTWLDDC